MKTKKNTPKAKTIKQAPAAKLGEPCPKCGGWLEDGGLDAVAVCARCSCVYGERLPPPQKKPGKPSVLDAWLSACGGVNGALRQTPEFRIVVGATTGMRFILPDGDAALSIEFEAGAGPSTCLATSPERMEYTGRDGKGERWAAVFKAIRVVKADGTPGTFTPRFACRLARVELDVCEEKTVARRKSRAASVAATIEAVKARVEKTAEREALREAADKALVAALAKSGKKSVFGADAKQDRGKREALSSPAVALVASLWQDARLHGLPRLKTLGRRVTYKDFFAANADELRAKGVADARDVERAVDVAKKSRLLKSWNKPKATKKAQLAGNSPERSVKH